MQGLIFILLSILLTPSLSSWARVLLSPAAGNTFNVIQYGAVGNGQTDDSQSFLKAWEDACGASEGTPTLEIPNGMTFMLSPVAFKGPCKANSVHVLLQGTIVAPSRDAWNGKNEWIQFAEINGLMIDGGGQIDGQGSSWWQDCNSNCERPTALHINDCQASRLTGIKHLNSAKNHISISGCSDFYISDLEITAPGESPNTDGIDISHSSAITIEKSIIGTGDDCIAINGGTSNIKITQVTCGPGHGISIGSLGEDGKYDTVEDVYVGGCTFKGCQNGARIKTWDGGAGYARKITFEDITLEDSRHPIIIDQFYSSHDGTQGPSKGSSVAVSDVTYRNVHGTSADDEAIIFNCAEESCKNIVLDQIDITLSDPGKDAQAVCKNAEGTATSTVPSVTCLSN
ncbi:hypothetical protein I3843_11G152700 [Carya illinoinensis]|uniref:Polygalacturonase At3g15720 n=1 Tax=Carya illinoinensis TaxID=32201 RepID=A0A8T1P371_CARIL|nr:probable polygalacturonase At3g15720 [Carya illinoinensis]XP_042948989.1 probable polygalacturonase At3g15720 [Carya illinoinensis]KAG6637115.1 hypothetical protein CIPAW_11G157100 [Carya illinoinensis]KAG7956993.1 hypothetical protein I3843_11G152700 [Carya illinoinensis]